MRNVQHWFVPRLPPLSGRSVPGYSALRFQDGGRQSIKTKVTAPPADRADQTSQRVDCDEATYSICLATCYSRED